MKFPLTRAERALVVGFYQSRELGGAALKNLRRAGFRRSAAVYCSATGEVGVEERGVSAGCGALAVAAVALISGILLLQLRGGSLLAGASLEVALQLAGSTLAAALFGWLAFRWLDARVARQHVVRFQRWIVHNESVVLVEVEAGETGRVVTVLREVDGEAPVTFVFHPPAKFDFESEEQLFRKEFSSSQRLAEKAIRLAQSMTIGTAATPRGESLLRRLRESERILKWTDASLTMSAEAHHAFALSAEWLLDNAYLIQGQINEIRRGLPEGYYAELPVIASGPQAGLPRVPDRDGNRGRERWRSGCGHGPDFS